MKQPKPARRDLFKGALALAIPVATAATYEKKDLERGPHHPCRIRQALVETGRLETGSIHPKHRQRRARGMRGRGRYA